MGGQRVYVRDVATRDGVITSVINGDLGNANTSFTYFDYSRLGYINGTIEHIIQNTTLTIELCNVGLDATDGLSRESVATATNGAGTSLTDSTLSALFATNADLVGIQLRIVQDDTTPSNVGLRRVVTAYTGATGAMTLSSALGAVTSGKTKYSLEDNPLQFGRRYSDPASTQWLDVTNLLTGAASHTTSGTWMFDTRIPMERLRIRRLTTNATNALTLRMTRGR